MISKLKKIYYYIFSKLKNEEEEMIRKYLSEEERKYFEEMHKFDKKHSVNLLKSVLVNKKLRDDILYIKLALLHDCGKDKDTKFTDRLKYAFLKKGKLISHPRVGFEKLKDVDYKLALLIMKHHNKNIHCEKLIEFRKLDDKS